MTPPRRKKLLVLSRRDTQGWHSPYSFFLRQWRQTRIISECVEAARQDGYKEYAIFDADETYLAGGHVDGTSELENIRSVTDKNHAPPVFTRSIATK